jgi:hypothetical protein
VPRAAHVNGAALVGMSLHERHRLVDRLCDRHPPTGTGDRPGRCHHREEHTPAGPLPVGRVPRARIDGDRVALRWITGHVFPGHALDVPALVGKGEPAARRAFGAPGGGHGHRRIA